MNNYQGANKKERFFEGWYFKHQKNNQIVVLIPGINIDEHGHKFAFIQVIVNGNSYCMQFKMSECRIASNQLYIKIGDNIFSKKGVKINIASKKFSLCGSLRYGPITPIRYPIMGIFYFLPGMECNHDIISMHHEIQGQLMYNGKILDFDKGSGYMEKDWGSSFPQSYIWLQCNRFIEDKCAVVVSIADIPLYRLNFQGCICVIHYKGMEYRLATYLGVRIITWNSKEISLQQGKYSLKIQIKEKQSAAPVTMSKLFAPNCGEMSRVIQEQHGFSARYKFFIGEKLLFDLTSMEASFEIVR